MTQNKQSYLHFEELNNEPNKTKKFCVLNKDLTVTLGEIRWFGNWRQYCFYSNDCIYDRKCMKEIIDFIDNLMEERKNKNG